MTDWTAGAAEAASRTAGRGTVLVTGATGFTGLTACRYLLQAGYAVVGVSRGGNALESARRSAPEAVWLTCDLTSPDDAARLLRIAKPDFVLHLAGLNAVRDSWERPLAHMQANLMATLHLLEAARLEHACRLLIVSSMLSVPPSESPAPPHPYSWSKSLQAASALAWARLFGLDVRVARPANLIGPGPSAGVCGLLARHAERLSRGEPLPPFRLSSLGEARDYVDVRDAVRAYELILRLGRPGAVYPVGTGRHRTLREVHEAAERAAGRAIPVEVPGHAGPPEALPDSEKTDLAAIRGLGWSPAWSFDQSMRDMFEYFRTIGRRETE
ncbi:NAD-dependent epimerase/dehydratase family protein [Paenibacillus thermoaerophilus]|uniref:NAD-dependent epimerase/dehydratase family protein n=1 Tax=Paenibacillus thermoaerophilus TaxID=1215385 RepID=A0ABW2V5U2_9BACL|nr:NAD-dependent epimerase/dehydratase family protein [Paenibacillus thermoaerophilus]TMV17713.1 NAD-dependent epimerase/dehydratase family protein [Paenibacillus thermoaerophilus]